MLTSVKKKGKKEKRKPHQKQQQQQNGCGGEHSCTKGRDCESEL